MEIRFRELCLLLIVVLATAAGTAAAQGGEIDGAGLRFVGMVPLTEIEDTYAVEIDFHSAMVSPDGTLLAWASGGDICVLALENGGETCYGDENQPVRVGSALYWSPTSQAVAFHEDPLRWMHESDIWLLDLTGGQYTNLTDDGLYGSFMDIDDTVDLDLVPTWDPVTGDLYFFRVTRTVEGGVANALYRFRAGDILTGAGPELVVDLTGDFAEPFPVYDMSYVSLDGSADISPDGTTLAFIARPELNQAEAVNVWLLDLASGEYRAVARQSEIVSAGVPAWYLEDSASQADWLEGLAWLPDNKTLVTTSFNGRYGLESMAPALFVLDTTSGDVTSLRDLSAIPDFKSYFTEPYTSEGHPAICGRQMFSVLLPDSELVVYTSGVVPTVDTIGFSASLLDLDGDVMQTVRLAMIPAEDFELLPVYATSAGETDGTIHALSQGYLLRFERIE